jgi:DnaJ-class molecular chaperone
MKMNLPIKFDIGDKCYPINFHVEQYTEKCDICSGEGEIWIKEYCVVCPKCNGAGNFLKFGKRTWYITPTCEIVHVRVEYSSNNPIDFYTVYDVKRSDGFKVSYKDENLFSSEEEARKECSKRNAEGAK